MLNLPRITLITILLLPALVMAHGPSRQKLVKEIDINAPADKVWSVVSDFCSIKDWSPSVTGCESNGNEPDSVRTITLESGQTMEEKLAKYDADKKMMMYFMVKPNTEAFPVNTHSLMISVNDNGGSSRVEFKGAFYRSFPGPNPPPDQTDEAAAAALGEFYMKGLEGIKQAAE